MILMQPIIKDIILSISDDVVSNLTQSFEKTYYGKMNYSSKNTILDSDNKLLKETIGFEIAFIHVITYFLAYSMSCSHEYMHILNILAAHDPTVPEFLLMVFLFLSARSCCLSSINNLHIHLN